LSTREALRQTFDQVALDYDEVRPSYPTTLIDDIIELSSLPVDGRILEVGCGTGIATRPFGERGYPMLSIDIGTELLNVARNNLRDHTNVEFRHAAFEDLGSTAGTFDLMIAATAFHWIDPESGYPAVADILNPGGSMAIFTGYHPEPLTGFFDEVQEIYQRVVPEWPDPRQGTPVAQRIAQKSSEIDRCKVFHPVTVKTYPWSRVYDTDRYLKLLNTFSGHRLLEGARRAELFDGIRNMIDSKYGGQVERPYLTTLYFARKGHQC
jgi:SAM-dependent methyltransferase